MDNPMISKRAMLKYEIRSSVEKDIYDHAKELDDKRWEELNAYATAVDATLFLTLHHRYHFTAQTLRAIWEDMVRLRIGQRLFFRGDGEYVEQETGKNIEDTAIYHDLMAIGVDIKAWEEEDICVDEVTGEVSFR
jgi:hypothetical protein